MRNALLFPAGKAARLFAVCLILGLMALLLGLMAPAAQAQEPVAPETAPDAETGLTLFGERCANCHGPLGQGDGELAANLSRPPASLASQEYIRQAVPSEMFETITNGILPMGEEAMPPMPPFGPQSSNPIAEANRWDLIAAIYSMGTLPGNLESGEIVYEESCQECHGPEGNEAAFDLTDQAYWATHSNEDVFELLAAGEATVAEHDAYTLQDEGLWNVVSFARTFSYAYADPFLAFAPIEAAVITGTVTNESTGELVTTDAPVELNAFTANFEPALTLTTTVGADGTFEFNVTQVAPDLVYVATVEHEGISFGSDFGQITRDDPTLSLPVAVYEKTTDPSTVNVGQLHIILEFTEEQVQVNELYQFSQNAPSVFVGESGNADEGTVVLALPTEATLSGFDRTFGGMDSFFPAENMMETEEGWADTVPLRPGQGTLSLLARYTLPYEEGMEISHPVYYDVSGVNLVLADVGVSVREEGAWQAQDAQAMGGSMFLNYSREMVPAGETVSFTLEGEPQPGAAPAGAGATTAAPDRNQTNELLIGAGVLLLALAVGAYFVYLWQQRQLEPEAALASASGGAATVEDAEALREALLVEIAGLDDAYEAGEIDGEAYEARRQKLKEELAAIWR